MAQWIWNYGDFEIYHSNKVMSRRQEFGADFPPLWHLSPISPNVSFFNEFSNSTEGYMTLHINGIGYLYIDSKRYPAETKVLISPGKHSVQISVMNLNGLPSAFAESDICPTDDTWYTINPKKTPVGTDIKYNSLSASPEVFQFSYTRTEYISRIEYNDGLLFDFGKELFGFLYINNISPSDSLLVSYGESKEEATDTEHSILFEKLSGKESYKLTQRAFRYIYIKGSKYAEIYADYEYLPLEYKGSFECDNKDINKIWDMCAYTLHLNTREVFLDGIKRDRWVWSGDAYQCYKFNNYIFFDKDIVKRTIIALRGSEPFNEHINTITDYSLYWVISLYDYYMSFDDVEFIKIMYPKAVTLMDFCAKRVNSDGFITGFENDWVFVDWSDIDKDGAVCAEQMLYIEANRTMAKLAKLIGEQSEKYEETADILIEKVNSFYWSVEKGAFIDTYESGRNNVTRHANIFAVMYNIATPQQKESILTNVLLNDDITKITTPYFEGYELDVMGMYGNFEYIENMLFSYWKGMLDLGADTVWEEFDPSLSGIEHYGMYGNKYAKSLCHAWGASPIYLLGKYYLGVTPTTPGYKTFEVKPHLGGFNFIKGTVPVNGGKVTVHMTKSELCVTADKDGGTLIYNHAKYSIQANTEIKIQIQGG